MLPCSTCGDPLRGDLTKIGARCPSCREPLYEPARDPRRTSGTHEALTGSRCTAHANNPAVGTCQRCGDYLCCVCWTRWHGQALCGKCLARSLEGGETAPVEARAHFRQAILAIVFGSLAWLITLLAFLMVFAGAAGQMNVILIGFGVLILLGSPAPAILGVGQGAAAIRARGDHMIMATIGLILSGLHVGMLIGMFTFSMWDS
jgi:hypothetical protein